MRRLLVLAVALNAPCAEASVSRLRTARDVSLAAARGDAAAMKGGAADAFDPGPLPVFGAVSTDPDGAAGALPPEPESPAAADLALAPPPELEPPVEAKSETGAAGFWSMWAIAFVPVRWVTGKAGAFGDVLGPALMVLFLPIALVLGAVGWAIGSLL